MNVAYGRPGCGETVARVVGILALVAVAATAHVARAQGRPDAAEVVKATGTVEVLRQGQPPWQPAGVGARLVEQDEIRALKGASAELRLPDTSTLLLAENSRIVTTRLHFDPRTRAREESIVHLVVGKVRAVVATAAVTLVRARQSNFIISTPGAVAAARGTSWTQTPDLIGVTDGQVACISLGSVRAVAIFTGDFYALAGQGSCTRFTMSGPGRSAFFDMTHNPLVGRGLDGPAEGVVDPSVASGSASPLAYGGGPSFTGFQSPRIHQLSTSESQPK